MDKFLRESVKTEISLYKYAGVSKTEMRNEVKALFEMHQQDGVMLEEAVGDKIASKVVSKVLSSLDRDIKNVRTIIDARERKGYVAGPLADKLKSLEAIRQKIAENRSGSESSIPTLALTIVSYSKAIVAVIGICAGFLGLAAGVVTAKKFGIDGLRSIANDAVKSASSVSNIKGSAVDVGKTLNTSSLKTLIKQLKDSNASADKIAAAEKLMKDAIREASRADLHKRAADNFLGKAAKETALAAQKARTDAMDKYIASKSAGVFKKAGLRISAFNDTMQARRLEGGLKDINTLNASYKRTADDLTMKARGATSNYNSVKGSADKLDAQVSQQMTAVIANLMKIVAVAVVISLLLVVISKILVSVYAGRLRAESAKQLAEKAINKSAGKTKSNVTQIKRVK